MHIDAVLLKRAFLRNILNFFSERGDIPVSIDSELLKQRWFLLQNEDTKEQHPISLSTLLPAFASDGSLDASKLSSLSIEANEEVAQRLADKPFGDHLTDLQTLFLMAALQAYSQQFSLDMEKLYAEARQKGLNDKQYAALAQSIEQARDSVIADVTATVGRVFTFEAPVLDASSVRAKLHASLILTPQTRVFMQDLGIASLFSEHNKLFHHISNGMDDGYLTEEQVHLLYWDDIEPLQVINLEPVNLSSSGNKGVNYFVPDAWGNVVLPDSFGGMTAKSTLNQIVGRIYQYQVSLSNGKVVDVFHLPVDTLEDVELTDEEIACLKRAASKDVKQFIHGAKGSHTLSQVAYIYQPELATNESSSLLAKQILQVDVAKIDTAKIDSVDRALEARHVSTLLNRLWSEFLLLEIKIAQRELSKKQTSEEQQHLDALTRLYTQVASHQLLSVSDLPSTEGLHSRVNFISTYQLLAQRVLTQAWYNSTVEELHQADLEWLITLVICPVDGKDADSTIDYERFQELFLEVDKTQTKLINYYFHALAMQAIISNSDIEHLSGDKVQRLSHDLLNLYEKLERELLQSPLTQSELHLLQKGAALVAGAAETLTAKLAEIPRDTDEVSQAKIKSELCYNFSSTLARFPLSDAQSVMAQYRQIISVLDKIKQVFITARNEKRKPATWWQEYQLTESEKTIYAQIISWHKGDLTTFINSIASSEYNEADCNTAMKLLGELKGKSLQELISRYPARDWSDDAVAAEQIKSSGLSKNILPELDYSVLVDKPALTNENIFLAESSRRNSSAESVDDGSYLFAELEQLITAEYELVKQSLSADNFNEQKLSEILKGKRNLALADWLSGTVGKGLVAEQRVLAKLRSLNQKVKDFNALSSLEEKQAFFDASGDGETFLAELTSLMLMLQTIYVQQNKVDRDDSMVASIMEGNAGRVLQQSSITENNAALVANMPKNIWLNIDMLHANGQGEIVEQLVIEWLNYAQLANSNIVLIEDANQEPSRLSDMVQQLALKGVFSVESKRIDFSSSEFEKPSFEKSQSVLIDIVREDRDASFAEYFNIRTPLDSDVDAHNQLYQQLAFEAGLLQKYEDFFKTGRGSLPTGKTFGFEINGLQLSPLVQTVSLTQFMTHGSKWLSHVVASKQRTRSFIGGFVEAQEALKKLLTDKLKRLEINEEQSLDWFCFSLGLQAPKYSDFRACIKSAMKHDAALEKGTLAYYKHAIFVSMISSDFSPQLQSLEKDAFIDFWQQAVDEYQKQNSASDFVFSEWLTNYMIVNISDFQEKHSQLEQQKESQLQTQQQQYILEFAGACVLQHEKVKGLSPENAIDNEQQVIELIQSSAKEYIGNIQAILQGNAPDWSAEKIADHHKNLKQLLQLTQVYLLSGMTKAKDKIELIHNELVVYNELGFLGEDNSFTKINQTSAAKDDFLFEKYLDLHHQVFPIGYQPVDKQGVMDKKDRLLDISRNRMVSELLHFGNTEADNLFFGLLDVDAKVYPAKYREAYSKLSAYQNRLRKYNVNVNDHDLVGLAEKTSALLQALEGSSAKPVTLLSGLVKHWPANVTDDFETKFARTIHHRLEAMVVECERIVLAASRGESGSMKKLPAEYFSFMEKNLRVFNKMFGLSFLELRIARLKEIQGEKINLSTFISDGASGVVLNATREEGFLRRYFNNLTLEDMSLPVRVDRLNTPELLKGTSNLDAIGLYQLQFMQKYMQVLLTDTLQYFNVNEYPKINDFYDLRAFVLQQTSNYAKSPGAYAVRLSKVMELVDRLEKFSGMYEQVWKKELYQDPAVFLSNALGSAFKSQSRVLSDVSDYLKAASQQEERDFIAQIKEVIETHGADDTQLSVTFMDNAPCLKISSEGDAVDDSYIPIVGVKAELKKAEQLLARNLLRDLLEDIATITQNRQWQFSWWERNIAGSQVNIKLDYCYYEIPEVVKLQFDEITTFLARPDVNEQDLMAFYQDQVANGTDTIQKQLSKERYNLYCSSRFFAAEPTKVEFPVVIEPQQKGLATSV